MRFNVIFHLKIGKFEKIITAGPLEKLSLKIWGIFSFLHIPTLLFEQYSFQTCHTLILEDIIVKHFLCLSKLAARMVTSTSSENFFYQRYELQNQNFDFETTKTLILHAWSIFFKGAHPTKLWSKKIFFMKSLSKFRSFDGMNLVFLFGRKAFKKTLLITFGPISNSIVFPTADSIVRICAHAN